MGRYENLRKQSLLKISVFYNVLNKLLIFSEMLIFYLFYSSDYCSNLIQIKQKF